MFLLSSNEYTFPLAALTIQNWTTTKFQTITQLSHRVPFPAFTGLSVFKQLLLWEAGTPGHAILILTFVSTSISTCAGVHLWEQLSSESLQFVRFRKMCTVESGQRLSKALELLHSPQIPSLFSPGTHSAKSFSVSWLESQTWKNLSVEQVLKRISLLSLFPKCMFSALPQFKWRMDRNSFRKLCTFPVSHLCYFCELKDPR